MHSFQYKTGKNPEYGKYSRDIALSYESLRIPNVHVVESPIKRDFPRLIKKYNAKWALDLNDGKYFIDDSPSAGPYPICVVYHANPSATRKKKDKIYHVKAEKVEKLLEDFRRKAYRDPTEIWLEKRLMGEEARFEQPFENHADSMSLDPRVLEITLIQGRPIDQSLDFLKKLVDYLQSVRL